MCVGAADTCQLSSLDCCCRCLCCSITLQIATEHRMTGWPDGEHAATWILRHRMLPTPCWPADQNGSAVVVVVTPCGGTHTHTHTAAVFSACIRCRFKLWFTVNGHAINGFEWFRIAIVKTVRWRQHTSFCMHSKHIRIFCEMMQKTRSENSGMNGWMWVWFVSTLCFELAFCMPTLHHYYDDLAIKKPPKEQSSWIYVYAIWYMNE